MEKQSITIYSPATVANVGPGFDILGFAIDRPGDIMTIEIISSLEHEIINRTPYNIPLEPEKNVAIVSLSAFLEHLGAEEKFCVTFHEKIPPGSGIGSSSASSAGSVFGANILLGAPLHREELVPFAARGEQVASGSAHADNVAPALLGGFVLVRSYNPLDLIEISSPLSLHCTVVHPDIQLATQESRKILKGNVPLKTAVEQAGNVAGLITGLLTSDFRLIRDSLHDVIAEPARSFLIPGFERLKEAALRAGALGSSISGSGPSVFSLCPDRELAEAVGREFERIFTEMSIPCKVFISGINHRGVSKIQD
ncbi:MAG: homoserine kinase [Bacteroides sp. SM23_62_1]|nr:MAG: homoserine kinase [Bacteroides sp. SM23_62_1]